MMAGHGAEIDAVGGPARHIPVLLNEVATALEPLAGVTIVDGTFGAGGYTRALLAAGANVIAIDRDPDAIRAGTDLASAFAGRLRLVHGTFSRLDAHAGGKVDGVVLDIGVSSMQLDEAERGFSFRTDGPLDMRMSAKRSNRRRCRQPLSRLATLRAFSASSAKSGMPAASPA